MSFLGLVYLSDMIIGLPTVLHFEYFVLISCLTFSLDMALHLPGLKDIQQHFKVLNFISNVELSMKNKVMTNKFQCNKILFSIMLGSLFI